MSPATEAQKDQVVTPEYIRMLLRKTDWVAYTTRVVQEVAKKAEQYRDARVRGMALASHIVFV